jgi:glycerophosphoryl diester phosphodiesterase
MDNHPLTISHRGVDAGNGVQNTIPALLKTAKEHPDYVEMDLHETKDHQFVVLHDENLQELAGVNKTPHELTLAQLQHLTVHENGHHAHLASFDEYLAAAKSVHQKLIVEIKTTPNDSADMLQRFITKYAATLIKHGDRVHSMNYQAVTQLRKGVPDLYTSFILPYALVAPKTNANAYTFEETTLDDTLVDAAHQQHQEIWAWTVNEAGDMQQMLFAGVDGIITDNLHLLKQTIRKYNDNPSYAARMQFFSNTLDDFENNGAID